MLISIPYSNIKICDISEILNHKSALESSKEIDYLSALIKNYKGRLELFHPSFKEFVIGKLKSNGLLQHYQEKLGNFFLTKKEIVQATYLLIDIALNKVDKYLYDVFPRLVSWGELDFALKVINAKLMVVRRNIDKGYLYYHLCNVHNLLGNREESTCCIDKALEYLKRAKHEEFYASALMFKAMNLIEQGQVSEATAIADEVFSNINKYAKESKALLLSNLSKIYIDLFEFEKGASASKEAFEIFEELGFIEGMKSSLVNLVSSLAQIDEYKEEAEKYGLRLLDIAKGTSAFIIEGIVLNSLASIYREKKEYEKAKDFSNRAIKLCQKYGMKDKVILNLINYGNIFRDEGDLKEAKNIYNEALFYAKEYKLNKCECRIYWILAGMDRQAGHLSLSIEFADKAITRSIETNFRYGIAVALEEKSKTLLLMNEPIKAAEALVASSEYFGEIEQFSESYQRNIYDAVIIYTDARDKIKANELINKLIESTIKKIEYGEIINLILDNSSEDTIVSNFEKLFEKYFTNKNNNLNIIKQFLSFISYCTKRKEIDGKRLFKKVIDVIIANLGIARFSYSILAIAIEQSSILFNQYDLDIVLKSLQEKLPFFYVREIGDDRIITTSIANKINLEIHVFTDEVTCNKLAISLSLILHELPNLVIEKKTFEETICKLRLYSYSEEVKSAIGQYLSEGEKSPFQEDVQSLHMSKANYAIDEMIIVNPDYEIKSNLSNLPDNKAFLYFLVTAVMGIKSHFYHSKVHESKEQRRFILNLVARLLGFSSEILDNSLKESKFEINMDKISLLISKLKH